MSLSKDYKKFFNLAIPLMTLIFNPGFGWAQPKVVVAEPIKDAGTVLKTEKITHEFLIRNEGNATLTITEVKPACSCTVADYDKTINAGKTGKVKVVIDPSSFNGPIVKGVTVFTNDVLSRSIELTIRATIVSLLTAKPGYARFIAVKGETGSTKQILQTITASDGISFNITGIENPITGLSVAFHEAGVSERLPDIPGKQWIIKMGLTNDAVVGALSGYVTIKTDHPKQSSIQIPVSGFVRPLIAATPPSADFGQITINEPLKKQINIRVFSSQPILVTKAETDIKGIDVKVESLDQGREYGVMLTLKPEMAKGSFNGKLIINTNNDKMPMLEIPLKGTIQ